MSAIDERRIRAEVIEECATVAEKYANSGQSKADKIHAAFDIAARIRALDSPYQRSVNGCWEGIPGRSK